MIYFLVNIHWRFIILYQYNTFIFIWCWYSILTQCIGYSTLHKTLLISLENNKTTSRSFSFIWKKRNCPVMIVSGTVLTNHCVFHFSSFQVKVCTLKNLLLLYLTYEHKMIACEVEHSCLCKKKIDYLPRKVQDIF